jgi:clan AA aspartic protease (TIGR02281 family)
LFLSLASCASSAFDKSIDIKKSRNTLYVDAKIQDEEFRMLLDTGSSFVVLTHNPGLKSNRKIMAVLADGRRVRTEVFRIPRINIAGCILKDVDAVVMSSGINILGMTALHKMSPVTINMNNGSLVFDCGRYEYNPLVLRCRGCYARSYKNF